MDTKVSKYKPEFEFTEYKRPSVSLEYIINESQIYEQVNIIGKIYAFSPEKVSVNGTPYIQCKVIDKTRNRDLKIFRDLIPKVVEIQVYKFNDLKVLIGGDMQKVLHTTTSTTIEAIDDISLSEIEVDVAILTEEEIKSIKGKVVSIDMRSIGVSYGCSRCFTIVEISEGFFLCDSCSLVGAADTVQSKKTDISFVFKDESNILHNLISNAELVEKFTEHTVRNKFQLGKCFMKMDQFTIIYKHPNIVQDMLKN